MQVKEESNTDFLERVISEENLFEINNEIVTNEEEDYVSLDETLFRPWRQPSYKQYLVGYLQNKYGKNKLQITNLFAAKVYKKMYFENIAKNPNIKPFDKIYAHPKITLADHDFLAKKKNDQNRYVFSSICLSLAFALGLYYKTGFGQFLRENSLHSALFFTVLPVGSCGISYKYYSWQIEKTLQKAGLHEKYSIK